MTGASSVSCGTLFVDRNRLPGYTGSDDTEEGCLFLEGTRKTRRWQSIKVQYQTTDGKPRIKTFTGWTAQIIQHEIDHCSGILI